jgi:hypothetical protein
MKLYTQARIHSLTQHARHAPRITRTHLMLRTVSENVAVRSFRSFKKLSSLANHMSYRMGVGVPWATRSVVLPADMMKLIGVLRNYPSLCRRK